MSNPGESQSQLEEPSAEQLKEAFVALVSDDLLTPLSAIQAAAELIQRLGDLGPSAGLVEQSVRSILAATGSLTVMVHDLLDISRLEAGSFPVEARPVSLRSFLQSVVTHLGLPLEGRLELRIPDGLPLAWADPSLVERTLRNLLSAALRHSPPSSPLLLAVTASEAELWIAITDHGDGIAAEDLPGVLGQTRRAPAGGLGLCLYITRRCVEALGGQIVVQSTPGAGSTFSFSLSRMKASQP
jgi:two-component system sensor histidine kinase KdpD